MLFKRSLQYCPFVRWLHVTPVTCEFPSHVTDKHAGQFYRISTHNIYGNWTLSPLGRGVGCDVSTLQMFEIFLHGKLRPLYQPGIDRMTRQCFRPKLHTMFTRRKNFWTGYFRDVKYVKTVYLLYVLERILLGFFFTYKMHIVHVSSQNANAQTYCCLEITIPY